MTLSLDQIAAAAEDAKRRQQAEGIRQMVADMATEIEAIKAEDWQAASDVERTPEQPAPLDWALQEAFAKAKEKELETLAEIVKPRFELEQEND